MVLVGVRQHQPEQAVAALDDERGIGRDDVDAGNAAVAEGHAQIDHQPLMAFGRSAVAVEIQVHADFAGAAERDEGQFGRRAAHGFFGALRR